MPQLRLCCTFQKGPHRAVIPDVFRLLEQARTLEAALQGMDIQELAQDLRDLHRLLEGIRRRHVTMENWLRALDEQKPR